MIRSIVHEAALRHAELGYPVFPCAPGEKLPATPNGFKDASSDPQQIDAWWTTKPASNIGIPTEGLLVLDIDVEANWLNDEPEKLLELAGAPLSRTPSGGRHYVFRQPAGRDWRNTQGEIAPHVDTRGNGGLFIAPPSALVGGKRYQWVEGCELDVPREQLPEPPAWLVEILDRLGSGATNRPTSPSLARVAASPATGNVIPDGQRNGTLAKLAGAMRRVGMSQGEIQAALLKANADRCRPPLDPREVYRIAESIGRYEPDQISVALVENHWEQMLAGAKPPEFQFTAITSRELETNTYTLDYLVEGVLVRGQPTVIAGPKKTLKTNISIDLALALGHGGLFLTRLNVPNAVRVGVMSGESGAATIQETARRIALSKNWTLENFTGVFWSFDVPQLNNHKHVEALTRFIADYELEVLILDPTYLMMLGLGQDAGNLFVVGEYLKSIGDVAQATGCTPILCHHLKKSIQEPYEPAELENIAWAGFQEFVRQWILLNRRVKYDPDHGGHHELWMSVGGSAGHSGLWGLNIDEGTRQDHGGRRWEVEVISAAEAYGQRAEAANEQLEERKQRQQQSRDEKHREAILNALRLHPAGETPRVIREMAAVSGSIATRHLDALIAEGLAEECTVKKHTREERGIRLTSQALSA
ncbi:MAG: bifunctional DNA primase/polymerase [Planctomycetaceae bacterium]